MYIIRAHLMNITFSVYVCAYGIWYFFLSYKQHCIILFDIHMPNKHSLRCNYVPGSMH